MSDRYAGWGDCSLKICLSANGFEEAIDMNYNKNIDVRKILTCTTTMDETLERIHSIEREPGSYMKVNDIL